MSISPAGTPCTSTNMAAAQPLFEKVDLRGEGELAKIHALLDEALEARMQVRGREQRQPGAAGSV